MPESGRLKNRFRCLVVGGPLPHHHRVERSDFVGFVFLRRKTIKIAFFGADQQMFVGKYQTATRALNGCLPKLLMIIPREGRHATGATCKNQVARFDCRLVERREQPRPLDDRVFLFTFERLEYRAAKVSTRWRKKTTSKATEITLGRSR